MSRPGVVPERAFRTRAQLPVGITKSGASLDAAAAAAKVSMVALKMIVLPTVLGAGLQVAIKPDLAQVRALREGPRARR